MQINTDSSDVNAKRARNNPPLPLQPGQAVPGYSLGAACTPFAQGLIYIPASVISQIDGCMYSLLGIRLERDVTAATYEASCCREFGCLPHMAWSTFIGLHFPGVDDGKLICMVDTAILHHALGVYIVPVAPHKSWYQSLLKHRLLEFQIPSFYSDPFTQPHPTEAVFVAIVARFGWFGKLKGTRRPERLIQLHAIAELECLGSAKVPAIPFLISRSSPIPSPPIDIADDTIPDAGPFIVAPGVVPPSVATSTWKPDALDAITMSTTFPFADVKAIASSAVRDGVDPYCGRTDKSVLHENKRLEPELAGPAMSHAIHVRR